MNKLKKKWFITLQGLLFASAGVSLISNDLNALYVSTLLTLSSVMGILFLLFNLKQKTFRLFKRMLIIEIALSIIAAIAFNTWGDSIGNFVFIFGLFSLLFGLIPFLFLFQNTSSGLSLSFKKEKYRIIGGTISGIFGSYLIFASEIVDPTEIINYVGGAIIIIGFSIIFDFIISLKIVRKKAAHNN